MERFLKGEWGKGKGKGEKGKGKRGRGKGNNGKGSSKKIGKTNRRRGWGKDKLISSIL